MNLKIRKKHNKMIFNRCFCCGNYMLIGTKDDIARDICPVCFWENDAIDDDNAESGANHMTLFAAVIGICMKIYVVYYKICPQAEKV